MAGRKPLGPALVEHLEGSDNAKERLELILATIAGQITVVAAAEQLGISEAMFYKLRNRVLQVCLEDLEPKPLGRPPERLSEDELQQRNWRRRSRNWSANWQPSRCDWNWRKRCRTW